MTSVSQIKFLKDLDNFFNSLEEDQFRFSDNLPLAIMRLREKDLKPILDEVMDMQINMNDDSKYPKRYDGTSLTENAYHVSESLHSHLSELLRYISCRFKLEKLMARNSLFDSCKYDNVILDRPWVNFQKKYDFMIRPSCGFLSFIIWIKVPYTMADEISDARYKNNTSSYPRIMFGPAAETMFRGNAASFPVSNMNESCIMIYDSEDLFIPPFYSSDDHLISVSGNLIYKEHLDVDSRMCNPLIEMHNFFLSSMKSKCNDENEQDGSVDSNLA